MVATMNRVRLDQFTRETWRKFDAKDLEPLKWAFDERHREVKESRRLAGVVKRDDVAMGEPRRDLDLTEEPVGA